MSILDDCCSCPETLAMASFPKQDWCEPYDWDKALAEGTIFPCMNLEFYCAEDINSSLHGNVPARDKEAERENLMNQINGISFAVNDLTLYLDTHPDCKNGLPLFKELLQKRLDLLAEYAKKYTPLTQISMVTGNPESNEYSWGEGPMPWEGGLI